MIDYGNCRFCGYPLQPVMVFDGDVVVINYLICPICGKKECIDDDTSIGWCIDD